MRKSFEISFYVKVFLVFFEEEGIGRDFLLVFIVRFLGELYLFLFIFLSSVDIGVLCVVLYFFSDLIRWRKFKFLFFVRIVRSLKFFLVLIIVYIVFLIVLSFRNF